jgi:hypothetical protein
LYKKKKGKLMGNFIKLTNIRTNPGEIYINMDLIVVIRQKESHTELYDLYTSDGSYDVQETPEEIINLMQKAKPLMS